MAHRTFANSSCKRILVFIAPRGIGFAAKPTSDSRLAGRCFLCPVKAPERACSTRPLVMSCKIKASSLVEPSSREQTAALFGALVAHLRTTKEYVQSGVFSKREAFSVQSSGVYYGGQLARLWRALWVTGVLHEVTFTWRLVSGATSDVYRQDTLSS